MRSTRSVVALRRAVLVVTLALVGVSCGGGGDDRACRTCTVSANCDGDEECVLAVDGKLRCFETDKAICTVDKVPVERAATPVPTATP